MTRENTYRNYRVSVIVPVYNGQDYIKDCIDSITAQTYSNIEIIVVDDGSTDKTANIVKQLNHNHLSYYYQNNGGAAAARNLGVTKAKGELVAFIDSDDLWLPHKIERQAAAIVEGADFVYCDYENISPSGEIISSFRSQVDPKLYTKTIKQTLLQKNIVAGGSSVLLKRTILDAIGSFDEKIVIGEDWELWTRIFWNGYKTKFINEKLFYCRRNLNSVQHTTSDQMWFQSIVHVNQSFLKLPDIGSVEKAIIYENLYRNACRFLTPWTAVLTYWKNLVLEGPSNLFKFSLWLVFGKYIIKKIVR